MECYQNQFQIHSAGILGTNRPLIKKKKLFQERPQNEKKGFQSSVSLIKKTSVRIPHVGHDEMRLKWYARSDATINVHDEYR